MKTNKNPGRNRMKVIDAMSHEESTIVVHIQSALNGNCWLQLIGAKFRIIDKSRPDEWIERWHFLSELISLPGLPRPLIVCRAANEGAFSCYRNLKYRRNSTSEPGVYPSLRGFSAKQKARSIARRDIDFPHSQRKRTLKKKLSYFSHLMNFKYLASITSLTLMYEKYKI